MKRKTIGKVQLVFGIIVLLVAAVGIGYMIMSYNQINDIMAGDLIALAGNAMVTSVISLIIIIFLFSSVMLVLSLVLILEGLANIAEK
jgi:hypothetical protein